MSSFNQPDQAEEHFHTAQVILFDPLRSKKRQQACIFCGQTLRTQTFKGKPVCVNCLRLIPALFLCGQM